MTEAAGLTIEPLEGARFGAEISGLEPRQITDAQRELLKGLWTSFHLR